MTPKTRQRLTAVHSSIMHTMNFDLRRSRCTMLWLVGNSVSVRLAVQGGLGVRLQGMSDVVANSAEELELKASYGAQLLSEYMKILADPACMTTHAHCCTRKQDDLRLMRGQIWRRLKNRCLCQKPFAQECMTPYGYFVAETAAKNSVDVDGGSDGKNDKNGGKKVLKVSVAGSTCTDFSIIGTQGADSRCRPLRN